MTVRCRHERVREKRFDIQAQALSLANDFYFLDFKTDDTQPIVAREPGNLRCRLKDGEIDKRGRFVPELETLWDTSPAPHCAAHNVRRTRSAQPISSSFKDSLILCGRLRTRRIFSCTGRDCFRSRSILLRAPKAAAPLAQNHCSSWQCHHGCCVNLSSLKACPVTALSNFLVYGS